MKIEIKRVVKKEVEETIEMRLQKYYAVRIIRSGNSKSCVGEKEFEYMPDEQEIAEVLILYHRHDCFATVVENYRLVEA